MAGVGINQGDLCQAPGFCGKVTRAEVPGQTCSDTINPTSRKDIGGGGLG